MPPDANNNSSYSILHKQDAITAWPRYCKNLAGQKAGGTFAEATDDSLPRLLRCAEQNNDSLRSRIATAHWATKDAQQYIQGWEIRHIADGVQNAGSF